MGVGDDGLTRIAKADFHVPSDASGKVETTAKKACFAPFTAPHYNSLRSTYLQVLCLAFLYGCGPTPVDEKLRRTDPSGKFDAIVVERGSDATVATPTQVFIAPKGQAIPPDIKSQPVIVADHVEKAEVTWPSAGRLRIDLKGGRIFRHLQSDEATAIVLELRVDGKVHKPEAP